MLACLPRMNLGNDRPSMVLKFHEPQNQQIDLVNDFAPFPLFSNPEFLQQHLYLCSNKSIFLSAYSPIFGIFL